MASYCVADAKAFYVAWRSGATLQQAGTRRWRSIARGAATFVAGIRGHA